MSASVLSSEQACIMCAAAPGSTPCGHGSSSNSFPPSVLAIFLFFTFKPCVHYLEIPVSKVREVWISKPRALFGSG
ncbi:unnamed protein product [Citrullus colocynthis]|uniref:Uncharacterized protein n=1 Tax=Citrullus colocynthis TaxID=252529 RepID=A0ABP0YZ43_9ROSI